MNTLGTIEVDITFELGAAIMPVHHQPRRIGLDIAENDPLRISASNR